MKHIKIFEIFSCIFNLAIKFLLIKFTIYFQIFVDQINGDITAITRHNPTTNESVLLIANTCFSTFEWTPSQEKGIFIDGKIDKILFELKTVEMEKRKVNF